MKPGDLVGQSVANLGRRKVRTILTLVGIVIGVGSLVLMVSLGIGVKLQFLKLFETEYLLRSIMVQRKGESNKNSGPFGDMFSLNIKSLTDEDLDRLRKIEGVQSVSPNLNLLLRAEFNEEDIPLLEIGGIPPDQEEDFKKFIMVGGPWSGADADECLISSRYIEQRKIEDPESLIGKKIVIYKDADDDDVGEYTVVGIVNAKKMGLFTGSRLQLPLKQALDLRKRMKGGLQPFMYAEGKYLGCEVTVADPRQVTEVTRRIKSEGFSVMTIMDIIDTINTIFLVLEGFLASIGAIGVIVALFGIANTMAMSVMERTREIGILKALGARRKTILRLFLIEAGWIGFIGGLAGLLAGWAFGQFLNFIAQRGFGVPADANLFHVSLWLAAGSMVFSIAVSLVAGVVPALRASRLDPVQALRYG